MKLFGRKPTTDPVVAPPPPESEMQAATITIGRECTTDAPIRWALLDRSGYPGSLAIVASAEHRSRLIGAAAAELALAGPFLLVDPLESLDLLQPLTSHRIGAGRGIDLVGAPKTETTTVARSNAAIAWWSASGAEWTPAVELILEQTIDALRRAGETPTIERLAHLLREAAARASDPQLRGGCARISEGLFSVLAAAPARALLTDPAGPLPSDRDLRISIDPEIRDSAEALRLSAPGILRLVAQLIAQRHDGSLLIPSLTDLGSRDLVERLVADLFWPLRSNGTGLVIGADALAPWPNEPGVPSSIVARADAWLVEADDHYRHGWEVILGERGDPVAMSARFDQVRELGGDALLIAPSVRAEPIALRAFNV